LPRVSKVSQVLDSGSESKPESRDGTRERGADSWEPPAGNRRILTDAIRSGRMVLFSYVDRQGRWTRRLVRPLSVYAYGGSKYLRAFCTLCKEERSFRLDRVRGLTISL
jgi:predicted DNA-binding transcriptional regulator YafY